MRLATSLICLSLFLATSSPVLAIEVAAEQATELLAKSRAVDLKCNFLTSTERDELSSLVARAEVALAQRESVAITKQVLARGNAAGKKAVCSPSQQAEVSSVLSAARTAAAQAPTMQAQIAQIPKAASIVPAAKPKKIRVAANIMVPQAKVTKLKPATAPTAGLANYASITERYYLARRCGSMSGSAISSLYQTVVSTHHRVLSKFGRGPVANVMHHSEAIAKAQRCS
jgi:hypothetical protein